MIRARMTCLAALLLALPAPADAVQRAITRSGEIIPEGASLPSFANSDFSDVVIDTGLQQLVDQLASDEYAEREAASVALVEGPFDRTQMYAVLVHQELDAEQRHRVLNAVIAQLLLAPRGAVGIGMNWVNEQVGEPGYVIVERLIPGFDAQRVLQPRDRITHVDQQPLFGRNDFSRLVQSKEPGEEVKLTIQRAKRDANDNVVQLDGRILFDTLEVAIRLGSLQELKSMPGDNNVIQAGDDTLSSELKWAQARFGGSRRTIEVKGGVPSRSPELIAADRHYEIVNLQRQIRQFEDGMIPDLDALRGVWMLKIEDLYKATQEPDISAEERLLREAVVNRFRELIEPYRTLE